MRRVQTAAVILALATPLAHADPACAPRPSGVVVADPPPVQTEFGRSIDLAHDRLIVGDPGYDPPDGPVNTGGAFVFIRGAGGWQQDAILTLTDLPMLDDLGWSVAIEGDIAVLGTPFNGRNEGEAFAFHRDAAGAWSFEANIKPDPAVTPRLFGYSMDLSNNVLAIGGLLSGQDAGGWVDLYTRFDGRWLQRAHLVPPNGVEGDEFGRSVSLDGGRLLAGAPGRFTTAFSGTAYLFAKTDAGWILDRSFIPEEPDHGDLFGYSVALEGRLAAVGAPGADFSRGRVWTYRLDHGRWFLDAVLEDPSAGASRAVRFGERVALRGDRLIVGAPETAGGAGAIYLFQRVDGAWVFHGRVRAEDASTSDARLRDLGRAIAVEGNLALAAAPITTLLPSDSAPIITGAVQQISLDAPSFGVTRHPGDLNAPPGDTLTLSVAVTGPGPIAYQWFRAGAPLADDGRISGAATSLLTIDGTTIDDSALYFVRVTSPSCGEVDSRSARVDFGGCPVILTDPPEEQTLHAGAAIMLHVDVDAPIEAELRWFAGVDPLEDDGRISGAHTQSLVITPSQPGDSSIYYLSVASACGQEVSETSTVSFHPCVELLRQPDPVFTFVGDTVRFHTEASSHLPLSYAWRRNGDLLFEGGRYAGTRTETLTIAAAQETDGGAFHCTISCGFNAVATAQASLSIRPQNCLGDANLDRRVDMVDLAAILQTWGANYRPGTGQGDSDRDGLVNFEDLSTTISRFGSGCS